MGHFAQNYGDCRPGPMEIHTWDLFSQVRRTNHYATGGAQGLHGIKPTHGFFEENPWGIVIFFKVENLFDSFLGSTCEASHKLFQAPFLEARPVLEKVRFLEGRRMGLWEVGVGRDPPETYFSPN